MQKCKLAKDLLIFIVAFNVFYNNLACKFLGFLYFCSQEELFDSKSTQIAEIRNVAKSLPL